MTIAGVAWIAMQDANGRQVSQFGVLKVILVKLPALIVLALLIGVPGIHRLALDDVRRKRHDDGRRVGRGRSAAITSSAPDHRQEAQ